MSGVFRPGPSLSPAPQPPALGTLSRASAPAATSPATTGNVSTVFGSSYGLGQRKRRKRWVTDEQLKRAFMAALLADQHVKQRKRAA